MLFRSSLLLLLIGVSLPVFTQSAHRALRRGDKAYTDKNYEAARQSYSDAVREENSAKGNYNLGNALFESGEFEEAAKRYEEAATLSRDEAVTADAYRNLGDALYQQEKYAEAVEAYKESLRRNPDDDPTKYNLSKAIRRMQPPPPQQDQQQQQSDQNQQDQDEQQQQQQGQSQGQPQNGNSQQEGEQQQDPSQQRPDGQSESEQQQEQEADPRQDPSNPNGESRANPRQASMSREEAERQLEIAADAEKETMKRLRQGNQSGCTAGKDW